MEQLKLLIADDEENIRNGLKCIINWNELGFKFCGEASNGKDAVSQIIDLHPDLVILDIKMPGLTGIEVISQIKEYCTQNNKKSPEFLILSGFSDFEYAQKTLNLGAKGYILKPVDEDELQEKVLSIKESILEKQKLNEVSKQSLEYYLTIFCQSLIKNPRTQLNTELLSLKFLENYQDSIYRCVIINLDDFNDSDIEKLTATIDTCFSFFTIVKFIQGNTYIIIIKSNNSSAINNCIERIAKSKNGPTYICAGDSMKGLNGIYFSYKSATELTKHLFFFSDVPFIESESLIQEKLVKYDPEQLINKLIFCIETYDKTQITNINQTLKDYFYDVNKTESEIKNQMIYILVELNKKITAKYPERDISDGKTFDVVHKIMDLSSFNDAFDFFETIINNYIENFNFNTSDSLIIKLISYIKTNYAQDLKLENLGDMFNCNSAYLGKKFKKYTGVQFNTYLDNIRIEQAKEKLLNTDLKIYQISKLVGYTNTDYFFMKFKKNTGITPKEFKNQVNKNNEE